MANILVIGNATLDVILTVDGYPPENAEVRAVARRVEAGGNGVNVARVLVRLGHACTWAGTVAGEPDGRFILDALVRYGVDTRAARVVSGGKTPTSYVLLDRRTGSRTIVHYRDLPEFGFEDFRTVDPGPFHWFHFEGRNVPETRRMLESLQRRAPGVPRSLEVEKPRDGIETLFPLADLLVFSRDFARARGYEDPVALLAAVRGQAPDADLVCAWGDAGAFALGRDGRRLRQPTFPPPRVVDTLGAGDTFNAGLIDALARGGTLAQALERGCRLAGRKCGQAGFDGLSVRDG